MNALFTITIKDQMELQLERYGLARANGPCVLIISPKGGDGLYDIRLTISFRIMDQQVTYEKSYSTTYTITLGRDTYFTMPRIGIPVIDLGVMKLEVGISPSLSFTPTNLFCFLKTEEENVAFDTSLLNYTLVRLLDKSY